MSKTLPLRTMYLAHCLRMHLLGVKPMSPSRFGDTALRMGVM